MDEDEKGTSASTKAEPEIEENTGESSSSEAVGSEEDRVDAASNDRNELKAIREEAVSGEVEPVEATPPPIPDILPVLPLRGLVVYPYAALPLMVGQARSVQLVDDAMRGNRLVALAAQIDPGVENARPDQVRRIGTAARILQLLRRP